MFGRGRQVGKGSCTSFVIADGGVTTRGGICPSRQSRRECKIFASGVKFSIFTHFLCFFLTKTVEIDGVKFLT